MVPLLWTAALGAACNATVANVFSGKHLPHCTTLAVVAPYVAHRAMEERGELTAAELLVHGIGMRAFYRCSSLSSVRFGSGLREIGRGAFAMTALEAVVIPYAVQHIGRNAFSAVGIRTMLLSPAMALRMQEPAGCTDGASRDELGWCDCGPAKNGRCARAPVPPIDAGALQYCAENDDTFDAALCCAYCADGAMCEQHRDPECDGYSVCDTGECGWRKSI